MKPSVMPATPLQGLSAFAMYKAQQKMAKKKKPKKGAKASRLLLSAADGKKLLRSCETTGHLLPMRDNIQRVLSAGNKVLRNGKHRKSAANGEEHKKKKKRRGMKNKKPPLPIMMVSTNSEVVLTPSEVVFKPSKVVSSPSKVVSSPSKVVSKPSKVVSKPSKVVSKPNKVVPKPSKGSILEGDQPAEKGYRMRILGPQSPGGEGTVRPPLTLKGAGRVPPPYYNSVEEGRKVLEWLIEPVPLEEFLSECWLREPRVVKRGQPDYYSHLRISAASLDAMLRTNHLQYGKNVDVTSYENGVRETHNDAGRALPSQVWDYYGNGCSVRWLNPQTYSSRLWLLNSTLQEFFGGMVGANVYLTPPNSQGFAPHFDDIEAFVLQLEGRKRWRLYRPSEKDVNPRFSSRNFKPNEIGKPFMEVTLEAGDLLYFPRGIVHQAEATDSHSLHVTISCYQHNTWADLLEQVVPAALSKAIAEDSAFREGLPLGHQGYVGSNCKEANGGRRVAFVDKVKNLVTRLLDYLPIDEGVDQMGKNFMAEALPPCLLSEEVPCSVYGSKMRIAAGGRVAGVSALQMMDENTKVKLVRQHCLRLVYEPGGPQLYYTTDNTCECQEVEQQSLELTPELVPGVAMLIYAYPKYLSVAELPIKDTDAKIAFTFNLWEKGLLLTKRPLTDSAA